MRQKATIQPATGRTVGTAPLSPVLRGVLIERYKRTCQHCGATSEHLTRGPNGTPWHVDHRTPRCLGGVDDLTNLVLSCQACNLRKHAAPPESAWQQKTSRGCRATLPTRLAKARRSLQWARSGHAQGVGNIAGALYMRVADLKALVEREHVPYRYVSGGTWLLSPANVERVLLLAGEFTLADLESGLAA